MRSKISILTMSIFMLLSSMAVLPIYAGDATVTDCTHFTGAGTISQAVIDANNGGGAISITCTGTIIFDNQLTIRADVILNNDSGGEVIFDETGDDNGFFFVRAGASFTLDGFTLQNGNSSLGGAIYTEFDSTLTINNSMFTNNSADGGGAIFNSDNTTLTINSSTFTGNSADDGGAIYNYNNGTLTIIDSTFTGNSTDYGGAIDNYGRLTIGSSTFTDNSADVGGAIFNHDTGTISSQNTHYENNTCFGAITDNGGNTVTNARGCPITEPVNDADTGDVTINTCDFATLQSTVSIANSGGGTISITCTGTIIFDDNLSIADNIIIQNDSGGEVIFDETGDDNHFFSVRRGVSLTLNGFTLQNGNAENGGAIFNDGTLTINDSTFINNSANFGGAIYNRGTLTVSNSTFTGNSASRNGGAIDNYETGTLTITNSMFTGNSADAGGAVFNVGTASSQDTHYENNTCFGDITDNGGNTITNSRGCPSDTPANDDTGDATINTCDFATLQSAVSIANSGGGAISITCTGTIIFEDNLSIADTVVIQNDSGGEVIFDEIGDNNRFFRVRDGVSFTLNGFILQNGNDFNVGAIFNSGTLTVSNSTFINNSGSTIFNSGTLTITNSTFTDNSASDSGGAIVNSGTLTIHNSTFTNNDGGTIVNSGTLTISNSTFTGNSAYGDGGAIVNDDKGTMTISNSTFTDNHGGSSYIGNILTSSNSNSDDFGGAVFNGGTLTINNSTFTGNSANYGSAIANRNKGTLTVNNSTFTDNSANGGGAIYNVGTLTINNSTFTGNSADYGGAIVNGGTISSQNTHYENNTCTGAIADNGGNTATNARGCPSDTPANDDIGDATITTCDFVTLQSAVDIANSGGGTISITCTGTIIFEDELTIADNVIIQNDSGGEVIFDEMGDDNGFFDVGGGASFTLNGFTLQNGNNKTGLSAGGAIYNRGTLTIYNSTFISNSATISGGAIENRGTLTISDSTFIGNSTIFSSGAISNSGTLTITNSTFTDNSASDNSGAISNSGRLTITDSTFTGNSTTRVGGAIRNSGTLTITNSTFTDNSASYGGAIFNDDYSTASSQDTHYENNTCSGDITDNGGNTVTDAPDCPGN